MNIDEIGSKISKLMSPGRYKHCVGVRFEAERLAKIYGADEKKAGIAGLVHDCAKEFEYSNMIMLCEKYGLELDNVVMNERKLIHAPLGAKFAKYELNIHDEEIYDAVYYHTTSKANMSLLTKIIYISDYTEPNRTFGGVEILRDIADKDLDKAVLVGLDYTINKLVSEGKMLHTETINARNDIIMKMRCNK